MNTRLVITLTLGFFLALSPIASTFAENDLGSRLVTNDQKARGMSYGEWAAEWWTWVLQAPSDTIPLFDETGEFCDANQSAQHGYKRGVFFLAGSWIGPVERECTVKVGTALFFPLINNFIAAFPEDEYPWTDVDWLREQIHCDVYPNLSVVIDGVELDLDPGDLYEQSVVFQVDEPNIFGPVLYPSVDEGYYLFLRPWWGPGEHTISFTAESGCSDWTQDVSYTINVVQGRNWRK